MLYVQLGHNSRVANARLAPYQGANSEYRDSHVIAVRYPRYMRIGKPPLSDCEVHSLRLACWQTHPPISPGAPPSQFLRELRVLPPPQATRLAQPIHRVSTSGDHQRGAQAVSGLLSRRSLPQIPL